jgi:hypothetical protein
MRFAVRPFNAGLIEMFRAAFRPRDLFLHDGTSLRRIRLGVGRQVAILAAALLLLGWAVGATARLITVTPAGQVAHMQAKVARIQSDYAAMERDALAQAARIEQRQAFLSALVEGRADARTLAAMLPDDNPGVPLTPLTEPYAKISSRQDALAGKALALAETRYRLTSAALRKLGFKDGRFTKSGEAVGMGGPYEPVTKASLSDDADPQFRALFLSWKKMDQIEREVISVPSARPTPSAAAPRCTPASTSPARSARRSMPPRTALSIAPNGPTATAISSRSATARGSRPAMAICPRFWSSPASA